MAGFTATCARRTSANVGEDRLNQRRRFFMDVGLWGGNYEGKAHTDFGLVCDGHVFLCSWLNMHGTGRALQQCGVLPAPVERVLSAEEDRGFIVRHARAFSPLTDGALFVLLPDLHLQLLRLTRSDNFKYNRNFRTPGSAVDIVSLESELAALLDAAEAEDAEVIQAGDCFELWEVQAHLINDHLTLTRARQDLNRERDPANVIRLREPWERMWSQRKVIPRNDYQHGITTFDHLVREGASHGVRGSVRNSHVDRLGVAFEDSDVIKDAIMGKYTQIFRGNRYGPRMRFMWIPGNHDNMLANNLYRSEGLDYGIRAGRHVPRQSVTGGGNHCIWVEHGHAYDIYNNNRVFDGDEKGYYYTRRYTLGDVLGEQGFHEGSIVRWLGDRGYDMRPRQLRRARQVFHEHQEVRLVAMGHTHGALLFDWDEFEHCRAAEQQRYIELQDAMGEAFADRAI